MANLLKRLLHKQALSQSKRDETKTDDGFVDAALRGAAVETVDRYGHAVAEHFYAFSHKGNQGNAHASLKSIAQLRINPDYEQQNIKQQAGFAAEIKSVARKNADAIVEGSDARYRRVDDLGGPANDPIADLVQVNGQGGRIAGTEVQVKFIGRNAEEQLGKLLGKDYRKYLEADVQIAIADERFEELMGVGGKGGLIDQKIQSLSEQVKRSENRGDTEAVKKQKARIADCKKLKKNLRKAGLTTEEAVEARKDPGRATAKDIHSLAHEAGFNQARICAVASGAIALVENLVRCAKGEQTAVQAAKRVVAVTAGASVEGYAIAYAGSVAQGFMLNSSSTYLNALAKTGVATALVTTVKDVGVVTRRYCAGELTGAECVDELCRKGIGTLGSSFGAVLGAGIGKQLGSKAAGIALGMAGSTIGYTVACYVYREVRLARREYQLAKQERIEIERQCERLLELIRQYRLEMDREAERHFAQTLLATGKGLSAIDDAIAADDVDGFLAGNAQIQFLLGHEIQFGNQREFDDFMMSNDSLRL